MNAGRQIRVRRLDSGMVAFVAESLIRWGVDTGVPSIAAELVQGSPDSTHGVSYIPLCSGDKWYIRVEILEGAALSDGSLIPFGRSVGRSTRRLRRVPPLGGEDISGVRALDGLIPRREPEVLRVPVAEALLADPTQREWLQLATLVLVLATAIHLAPNAEERPS